jgi:hypothetical protein
VGGPLPSMNGGESGVGCLSWVLVSGVSAPEWAGEL